MSKSLKKQVGSHVYLKVRGYLLHKVSDQVLSKVLSKVDDEVYEQVYRQVWNQIWFIKVIKVEDHE